VPKKPIPKTLSGFHVAPNCNDCHIPFATKHYKKSWFFKLFNLIRLSFVTKTFDILRILIWHEFFCWIIWLKWVFWLLIKCDINQIGQQENTYIKKNKACKPLVKWDIFIFWWLKSFNKTEHILGLIVKRHGYFHLIAMMIYGTSDVVVQIFQTWDKISF
jgi:hypothetical protein